MHYLKLVSAIEILIDYKITAQDLERAKDLLIEFYSDYERLYYRYNVERIAACLPTMHLILHLVESVQDCGPGWVYWQFPCERVCGLLKPKVKNRMTFNRNLSLAILQEEQLNNLRFATTYKQSTKPSAAARLTVEIGNVSYQFFGPQLQDELSNTEATRLKAHYDAYFNNPREEIVKDFTKEITKYARCGLPGDVDHIRSAWNEERRRDLAVYVRQASVIQYSEYITNEMNQQQQITRYGKVLFFFCHTQFERKRMLAYVQRYHHEDHSRLMEEVRDGKIVEMTGEGQKEVIWVTAIDAGIGILSAGGKQYFINRGTVFKETIEGE